MRTITRQVFDQIISGTAATWYSPAESNQVLGSADAFAIQACTTTVSGTSPTLTVVSEHSSDGENWAPTGFTELIGQEIEEGSSYAGISDFAAVLGANVRFKITLGGTNPRCRLKLYFTGRTLGAR